MDRGRANDEGRNPGRFAVFVDAVFDIAMYVRVVEERGLLNVGHIGVDLDRRLLVAFADVVEAAGPTDVDERVFGALTQALDQGFGGREVVC